MISTDLLWPELIGGPLNGRSVPPIPEGRKHLILPYWPPESIDVPQQYPDVLYKLSSKIEEVIYIRSWLSPGIGRHIFFGTMKKCLYLKQYTQHGIKS